MMNGEFFCRTNSTINDEIRRGNLPNIRVVVDDTKAQTRRVVRVNIAADPVAQPGAVADRWRVVENALGQGKPAPEPHDVLLSSGMSTQLDLKRVSTSRKRLTMLRRECWPGMYRVRNFRLRRVKTTMRKLRTSWNVA